MMSELESFLKQTFRNMVVSLGDSFRIVFKHRFLYILQHSRSWGLKYYRIKFFYIYIFSQFQFEMNRILPVCFVISTFLSW